MIYTTSSTTSNRTSFHSGAVHQIVIFLEPPAPPPPDPARVEELLASAKRQYRKFAKEAHPDAGGSTEKMQSLNAEYEEIKRRIRAGVIR